MRISFFALVGGGLLLGTAHAQEITLETSPPVVVTTVPEAGSTEVEPGMMEFRVTFSKEMQDGSWSWSTASEEFFPETAGKPKFDEDRRTCVLPVKLRPGKTYANWINSQKFHNFKDAKGRPAVPYLLVFKTSPEPSGDSSNQPVLSAKSSNTSTAEMGTKTEAYWNRCIKVNRQFVTDKGEVLVQGIPAGRCWHHMPGCGQAVTRARQFRR